MTPSSSFAVKGSFTKVKGVIAYLINRLPSETSFRAVRACVVSVSTDIPIVLLRDAALGMSEGEGHFS